MENKTYKAKKLTPRLYANEYSMPHTVSITLLSANPAFLVSHPGSPLTPNSLRLSDGMLVYGVAREQIPGHRTAKILTLFASATFTLMKGITS